MWSWRRRETHQLHPVGPVGPASCEACGDGLAHCHGTLVLHADGVLDCDEAVCGADPSLHEWWVSCIDLETQCGCLGDEQPITVVAEAA